MKKKLALIVTGTVALATLSLTLPSVLAQTTNTPPPVAPRHLIHPHIHMAIRELEATKLELQKADHDFGGHRQAALDACNAAITQLREALKYDRK